jgi:hypothetical protein
MPGVALRSAILKLGGFWRESDLQAIHIRDCASGNLLTEGYLRGFRTIEVLLALRESRELK